VSVLNHYKVLAVDPSSSRTGYAVGLVDGSVFSVLCAGVIVPHPKQSSILRAEVSAWAVYEVVLGHRLPWVRHVGENGPHVCARAVVEVPSARGSFRGTSGAGLAVYGFAAGVLWHSLDYLKERRIAVTPEAWTGSRSKVARKQIALKWFPALAELKDPGLDSSDAVSLLVWAFQTGRLISEA